MPFFCPIHFIIFVDLYLRVTRRRGPPWNGSTSMLVGDMSTWRGKFKVVDSWNYCKFVNLFKCHWHCRWFWRCGPLLYLWKSHLDNMPTWCTTIFLRDNSMEVGDLPTCKWVNGPGSLRNIYTLIASPIYVLLINI